MQAACLFVLAVCVANVCGQESSAPASGFDAENYEYQHPLRRFARQGMPTPPDTGAMTPPPDMPEYKPQFINRKRREAKGIGGSMPTRKG